MTKLLLIEDDEAFAWRFQFALNQANRFFDITHVSRLSTAMEALANDDFDLVVTDLNLPDAERLDTLERIRKFDTRVPVIIVSSFESKKLSLEALHVGALDYIPKHEFQPQTLVRSIDYALERHRCDREKASLIEQLERQKEQLDEQNHRLRELVDSAHRFVDNVSHEFRTPLTVIREYAALMRDGVVGDVVDQQRDFLDVITYRCDDLNTMVDDMLDSSKLDADILGVHRSAVAAVDFVRPVVDGLALKARLRGMELRVEAEPDLPEVYCDAEKAGRIVTNLVSNAIKFTDEESGCITVKIQRSVIDDEVVVSVTDNGPGIPAEELGLLYGRFQQLGTSTQVSTKGFGLGLSIARELVDINLGTISVDSVVGEGTTFSFTLPVNSWPEIVRRFAVRLSGRDESSSLAAFEVTAQADDPKDLRVLDAFWRYTENQNDLIREVQPGHWIMLSPGSSDDLASIVERFSSQHRAVSRNCHRVMPELAFRSLGCFATSSELEELLEAVCGELVLC